MAIMKTSFPIHPSVNNIFDLLSKMKGKSKDEIFRQALEQFLKSQEKEIRALISKDYEPQMTNLDNLRKSDLAKRESLLKKRETDLSEEEKVQVSDELDKIEDNLRYYESAINEIRFDIHSIISDLEDNLAKF